VALQRGPFGGVADQVSGPVHLCILFPVNRQERCTPDVTARDQLRRERVFPFHGTERCPQPVMCRWQQLVAKAEIGACFVPADTYYGQRMLAWQVAAQLPPGRAGLTSEVDKRVTNDRPCQLSLRFIN
jgi:hypothetical protein